MHLKLIKILFNWMKNIDRKKNYILVLLKSADILLFSFKKLKKEFYRDKRKEQKI